MLLSKQELSYLMERQEKLDSFLFEKKSVDKEAVLNKRKLAMVIEFSEFVNDWQQFKYWKVNNQPKDTMVEEFVDALHFALSLTNDLVSDVQVEKQKTKVEKDDVLNVIEVLFKTRMKKNITLEEHFFSIFELPSMEHLTGVYYLSRLLVVGDLVGLNSKEIMTTYEKKNKVNFERQENNY